MAKVTIIFEDLPSGEINVTYSTEPKPDPGAEPTPAMYHATATLNMCQKLCEPMAPTPLAE